MCRLAAYLGPAVPIAHVVVDPAHSLLEQSQHANEAKLAVQGDGFGFAWYADGQGPGLYRDVLPAWSDGNLLSLCQMIRSPLFLAHVRASTTGETTRLNCHPFVHRRWSFMHNGQVPDIDRIRRKLEALLPDDLYLARRGTTDSELIFLLLLAYGMERDPAGAVRAVVALLRKHSSYGQGCDEAVRLTCVMSDGATIYAFRHSSDARAPSLYVAETTEGGWILASEPLEADTLVWSAIEPDSLVMLSLEGLTRLELDLAVARAA
ncbi:class II glutamine amidotransferase [Marivita sp. XM-24bin2]|jgi:glutamine amidotransferase|uniref:class II glutamine amidotransferase n=1 Tax=unclassified Marivita TaxID=2632480 RepID=UPI000D7A416B|nr:class II glutamine amidotransferase [Marivita sp. XM-24bin2]MCR9108439.1 class II glutamine amidotransferase [Paracoccaceae bacterium]PWL34388.1 MAG: class II glutamine amidotransferase [Marivita sp. XM-24bin2]